MSERLFLATDAERIWPFDALIPNLLHFYHVNYVTQRCYGYVQFSLINYANSNNTFVNKSHSSRAAHRRYAKTVESLKLVLLCASYKAKIPKLAGFAVGRFTHLFSATSQEYVCFYCLFALFG